MQAWEGWFAKQGGAARAVFRAGSTECCHSQLAVPSLGAEVSPPAQPANPPHCTPPNHLQQVGALPQHLLRLRRLHWQRSNVLHILDASGQPRVQQGSGLAPTRVPITGLDQGWVRGPAWLEGH